MNSWQVMCSQLDLWLDPTCGFARCRPYGVFCLCHVDVALRPMKTYQIWGCLACRWPPLLATRFLQSACLGRVSTACSCAWLDSCCTVSWFTLSFHSRATLLTPRTPLNREGGWCCDFARAGFRQNLGRLPISRLVSNPWPQKGFLFWDWGVYTAYIMCWPWHVCCPMKVRVGSMGFVWLLVYFDKPNAHRVITTVIYTSWQEDCGHSFHNMYSDINSDIASEMVFPQNFGLFCWWYISNVYIYYYIYMHQI